MHHVEVCYTEENEKDKLKFFLDVEISSDHISTVNKALVWHDSYTAIEMFSKLSRVD